MRLEHSLVLCACVLGLLLGGPVEAKRKDGPGGGPPDTPNPILSFASDQSEYQLGASARLSWASVDTKFCNASGDWDGKFATEGTWSSPALDGPKTFTLKCASRGGGVTSTLQIAIATQEPDPEPTPEPTPDPEPEPAPTPPPTIVFEVAASEVAVGGSTTLSWTTTDVDSCGASGGWSGDKSPSGSEEIGPIDASTTFTLSCGGAGGNAVEMVSVSAIGSIAINWVAPSENVDGSRLTDLAGYRIYYGTEPRSYEHSIEVSDPGATSHVFSAGSGDYFLAMTAVDTDLNESAFSNEVLKTVP